MVDYNANLLSTPTIRSASIDPRGVIPAHLVSQPEIRSVSIDPRGVIPATALRIAPPVCPEPVWPTSVPFIIDSDTIAVWAMDDTATSVAIEDSGGLYTPDSITGTAQFVRGPTSSQMARYFNGSTRYARSSNDAAIRLAMLGEWTFEAFAFISSYPPAQYYLFTFDAVGETEDTNCLGGCQITPSGKLMNFTERDAGVNEVFTQVAGGTVPVGEWVHLAWVMKLDLLLELPRTCEFYISGVLQDAAGGLPASGGTSAKVHLGGASGSFMTGALAQVQLSKVARSAAYLLASATNHAPVPDADTVALWAMQEPPHIRDHGGSKLHLTAISTATQATPVRSPVRGLARGLWVPTSGAEAGIYQACELRNTEVRALIPEPWTLEFWVDLIRGVSATPDSLTFRGVGETEATNYQFRAWYSTTTRKVVMFWEYAAGADINIVSGELFATDSDQYFAPFLVAVTRYFDSGSGNWVVSFWRNGELVSTGTNSQGPTGGSSGILVALKGTVSGPMRWSSKVRSGAELLGSYEMGRINPLQVGQGTQMFLMRGWRPNTLDYETWAVSGAPNFDNPSGAPIQNVTIQNTWIAE